MRTSESITALTSALFESKKVMTAVEKGGRNHHDGYDYAKLEDYMAVVRPCLESHGLLLVTSAPSVRAIEGRKTAKGMPQYACYIELKLRVVHAESGEWLEVDAHGEGQDRADKAVYKATTGARKYGVAMLFDLVTTEDPEKDASVGLDQVGNQGQPNNGRPGSREAVNPAGFI